MSITKNLESEVESATSYEQLQLKKRIAPLGEKVYPKPLRPLVHRSLVDEIGFTSSEKMALRTAWRLLKSKERRHGANLFYTFLTKYENQIEPFRYQGKICLSALHNHAAATIRITGFLIEDCLDDLLSFRTIIANYFDIHFVRGVNLDSIFLLAEELKAHILAVLEPISSPTLVSAFDKIIHMIGVLDTTGVILSKPKRNSDQSVTSTTDISLSTGISMYSKLSEDKDRERPSIFEKKRANNQSHFRL